MSATDLGTWDAIVIGAGPAGLAAALRAAVLGRTVLLVSRGPAGGSIQHVERIALVPQFPVGLSGPELTVRALQRARELGIHVRTRVGVLRLEPGVEAPHQVHLADGVVEQARGVIVATGVERDVGGLSGAERLLGAGVHTRAPCAAAAAGRLVVAGSLGHAFRVALDFARPADHVRVVTGEPLTPAVRRELRAHGNISVLAEHELLAAEGTDRLEVVMVRDQRTGRVRAYCADTLWLTGAERARTDWLGPTFTRDDARRLRCGSGAFPAETEHVGVFAAGDCRADADCGRSALTDGSAVADQVHSRLRLSAERAA